MRLMFLPAVLLAAIAIAGCKSDPPPPPPEEIMAQAQTRLSNVSSVRGNLSLSGDACQYGYIKLAWTDQPAVRMEFAGLDDGQQVQAESMTVMGTSYSRANEDTAWAPGPSQLLPTEVDLMPILQMTSISEVTPFDIGGEGQEVEAYKVNGTAPGSTIGPLPSIIPPPGEVQKSLLIRGDTWEVLHVDSTFTTAEGNCRTVWEFSNYDGVAHMDAPIASAP